MNWHLIAYDVCERTRLQRLQRWLRRHATYLQESVAIFHGDAAALSRLIEGLRERVHLRADDLRIFPIHSPDDLWLFGSHPLAGGVLELPS